MIAAAILLAATVQTPIPVARVAEDARVVDRVAEVSKRDLPSDLLGRLVNEDIELLRGRRSDGTYAYASYDRFETGRHSDSFSIDNTDANKPTRVEISGSWVYRLIISLPARRLLVAHNHKIYIDRVDIEYIPAGASTTKVQNVKIGAWIDPGSLKVIDIEQVARQATARVYAHADPEGYSDVELSLLQAKIVDDPESPYADAVSSAKAILRGLDHNDIPSIRAMAMRVANDLQPMNVATSAAPAAQSAPPASAVDVIAPRAGDAELYQQLQSIEDLLTGSETERRQGMDQLHQLLRRLRQSR